MSILVTSGSTSLGLLQESCETEIRRDNGNIRISKRCKQQQACNNNAKGNDNNCPGTNPNPFCFYCCTHSLCNKQLVDNPLSESPHALGGRQGSHDQCCLMWHLLLVGVCSFREVINVLTKWTEYITHLSVCKIIKIINDIIRVTLSD